MAVIWLPIVLCCPDATVTIPPSQPGAPTLATDGRNTSLVVPMRPALEMQLGSR